MNSYGDSNFRNVETTAKKGLFGMNGLLRIHTRTQGREREKERENLF